MKVLRSSKRRVLLAALGVALLSVPAAANSAARTVTHAGGNPSITVWVFAGQGTGYQKALAEDTKDFENKYHANATLVYKNFNDVSASARLILSGPAAPDVIQLPQGWAMVSLVGSGLLANLNPYEKQFGWGKRFAQDALVDSEATSDGKYFGRGNLYGVSDSQTFIGMYYNKTLLASLHLHLPQSLAEFQHDMALAKSHGIIPIGFGDSDKDAAGQVWYQLVDQYAPAAQVNAFTFGSAKGNLTGPKVLQSFNTLASWGKNGYFTPGYLGITQSEGFSQFINGKGLFALPGGSWHVGDIYAAGNQSKFGFTLLPPLKAGARPVTVNTANNEYSISAKSKNQALAADWLNEITTKVAAQRALTLAQEIPDENFQLKYSHTGLFGDVLNTYQKVLKGTSTPFVDFASPSMPDQLNANIQSLLGGKMSASAVVSAMNSNQTAFINTLGR